MNRRLKDKRSLLRFIPIIFLIVLCSCGLYTFNQMQTTMSDGADVVEVSGRNVSFGGITFDNEKMSKDEFRDLMKNLDAKLLTKLQDMKDSRSNSDDHDPEAHVNSYKTRLRELKKSYKQHKQHADKKNSIGWELKKRIETIESDRPF